MIHSLLERQWPMLFYFGGALLGLAVATFAQPLPREMVAFSGAIGFMLLFVGFGYWKVNVKRPKKKKWNLDVNPDDL